MPIRRARAKAAEHLRQAVDQLAVAAGLARARGVVVAYPDVHSAERVIGLVRQAREGIPVVVRAADDTMVNRLKAAGATEVIPEVLEGSLMIAAECLVQFGVPVEQAMTRVRAVRAERYSSLREFYRQAEATPPSGEER